MNRERVFWILMPVLTLTVITLGIELAVRLIVDDGMQFDLEMWKYARDLKQVASDPQVGHVHRPGSQAHLMGVDVAINTKGLRDREIGYARAPGTLRILMLGDSFTEGWGVALDDTFAKRIERLFAQRGVAAEVINAGVGNYNTVMEVASFFDEGRKYEPDIIVLNFTFNDAEPVPAHDVPHPLLQFCEACVYLFGRADTILRETSVRPEWKDYYLGLYGGGSSAGWGDAKASIARLAAYAKANNIELLIASLPELHELKPYPLQAITTLVQDAAKENGVDFVDVLPALQNEPPQSLWAAPSDPHPNARAHALISDALFRKLVTISDARRPDAPPRTALQDTREFPR
jgi:lysophospholipase L1-like esterase